MARQTEEQKLIHKWWMRLIIGVVFIGIAYGFASLAIDSGSLWQYALAIIFLVWGVKHLLRGLRAAF